MDKTASPDGRQDRILAAVAIAAAASIHLSIAAAQILLGLGILLTLLFRRRLSFPSIWLPLLLFCAWTILADAVSPDPLGGLTFLRKFFDYLFIPLMYAALVRQWDSRSYYVLLASTATATLSGIWGFIQYAQKYAHAKATSQAFYEMYLARRITGFQSHWLTFGALQLGALSLVLAHLLFSQRKMPRWAYASIAVFLLAIYLSWDRSIWLASLPVLLYLIWFWRPKLILLVPVVAILAFVLAPPATRARIESVVHPHGDTDSNRFRVVTFRTGLRMIESHPLFGLGPTGVKRDFDHYVPADVQRPLPTGYYGHLHDTYVEYAAERGLPALVFLLWFIGAVLWNCARGIATPAPPGHNELWLLHATIAIIIGVLVGGLFEHNLGDSHVLMMLMAIIGLAYSALASRRAQASNMQPDLES